MFERLEFIKCLLGSKDINSCLMSIPKRLFMNNYVYVLKLYCVLALLLMQKKYSNEFIWSFYLGLCLNVKSRFT